MCVCVCSGGMKLKGVSATCQVVEERDKDEARSAEVEEGEMKEDELEEGEEVEEGEAVDDDDDDDNEEEGILLSEGSHIDEGNKQHANLIFVIILVCLYDVLL